MPDERRVQYEYIAHQINREDSLANNRIGWALQLSGFLFAALAFVGNKDAMPDLVRFFGVVIPLVGMTTSAAGVVGVCAAQRQIRYLKNLWSANEEHFEGWPRPFGEPSASLLGIFSAIGPLGALTLCWSAILVNQVLRTLH